MSRTLVASDLDRTIVYSAAALRLPGPDADAPPLVVAEVYEGAPLSFLTRAAEEDLGRIAARALLVPVTTRTRAQFARIRLPRSADEWAVTTNGATILHDGEPDAAWARSLAERVRAESAALPEVRALLAAGGDQVLRIRDAEEVFVYGIVDRARLDAAFLAAVEESCARVGWRVSLQGRKLYCVPEAVRKADAVAAIVDRTGAGVVVAAGDSLLDQEMLERADIAVRPAHGELHDAGWLAPHLQVTRADGVLGGEELVRRILGAI